MIYPVDSTIFNLSVNNWDLLNQNAESHVYTVEAKEESSGNMAGPTFFLHQKDTIFCGFDWKP